MQIVLISIILVGGAIFFFITYINEEAGKPHKPNEIQRKKYPIEAVGRRLDSIKNRSDYEDIKYIHQKAVYSYNMYVNTIISTQPLGKKPLDPFVAGGMANGIAGLGPGLAVGVNQLAKQQKYENELRNFNASIRNIKSWEAECEFWIAKAKEYFALHGEELDDFGMFHRIETKENNASQPSEIAEKTRIELSAAEKVKEYKLGKRLAAQNDYAKKKEALVHLERIQSYKDVSSIIDSLREEIKQKEIEEKRKEKEIARKKLIKILLITLISGILVVACATYLFVIRPSQLKRNTYEKAVSMLETNSYDDAKVLFENLGDYLDSVAMIDECLYQKALKLYNEKDYDEAEQCFGYIHDYKDSSDMISKIRDERVEIEYQKAEDSFAIGDWDTAKRIYDRLGSIKDCKEKSIQCIYNQLVEKLEKTSLNDALSLAALSEEFEGLNYADSSKKSIELKKMTADAYMTQEKYYKAYWKYKELPSSYSGLNNLLVEAKNAFYYRRLCEWNSVADKWNYIVLLPDDYKDVAEIKEKYGKYAACCGEYGIKREGSKSGTTYYEVDFLIDNSSIIAKVNGKDSFASSGGKGTVCKSDKKGYTWKLEIEGIYNTHVFYVSAQKLLPFFDSSSIDKVEDVGQYSSYIESMYFGGSQVPGIDN